MDEWTWEFKEQAWYHKPCDVYVPGDATDQRCLICRQRTPDAHTWADLDAFVKAEGLDADEYFSFDRDLNPNHQIFCPASAHVLVYWRPGGSEGYYLHIDRQGADGLHNMALGKFWGAAAAAAAAEKVTRFVYAV